MNSKKYKLMWTEENHNVYDIWPILRNYSEGSEKRFGYGIKNGAVFGKDFIASFYVPEEEVKRITQEGYKMLSDPVRFKDLIKEIDSSTLAMKKYVEKVSKLDLSNLSNDEFDQVYAGSACIIPVFVAYSMTQPERYRLLERKLEDFIDRSMVKDKLKTFSILTKSKRRFVFPEKTNQLFDTFEDSLKHEEAVLNFNLANLETYTIVKNDMSDKEKMIEELEPNEGMKHVIDTLSTLGEERLKMRMVWMMGLYYNEIFLAEIKRRFKITKSDLRNYEQDEINLLVSSGERVSEDKINKRREGVLKVLDDGKKIIFEGKKALDYFKKNIETKVVSKKSLNGTVASAGKAKGRAVIFSYARSQEHAEKIKKMKEGDVLIAEMTRPNLVVAMKKACAVVTDEGGILSHAAIVSREFKIPCVVGTEEATKVIKDGDIVEVDAEKGIVTKIS